MHYLTVANLAKRLDAGDISLVEDLRKVKVPQKNKSDLRNYKKFADIIKTFQKAYGLEQYDFKDTDRYLWQLGKELRQPK